MNEDDEDPNTYTLTFTLSFPHENDTVYIAHCFPYRYRTDVQAAYICTDVQIAYLCKAVQIAYIFTDVHIAYLCKAVQIAYICTDVQIL